MTVSKLIYDYETAHAKRGENHYFFSPESLRWFGERRSDMRVFKETTKIEGILGDTHVCYVLSTYQRKAPGGPQRKYHYFDVETFERILPK
jgi:hypothetical protein